MIASAEVLEQQPGRSADQAQVLTLLVTGRLGRCALSGVHVHQVERVAKLLKLPRRQRNALMRRPAKLASLTLITQLKGGGLIRLSDLHELDASGWLVSVKDTQQLLNHQPAPTSLVV